MIRVKVVKNNGPWVEGDIARVTPNVAHGLIEQGFAKLYRAPSNKMMEPKTSKKKYVIK